MQTISKEEKFKLIKDSIPESQKKPVPGLVDRPLRPLKRPALPKGRRARDKQNKQGPTVRRKRKVFRKQKGYRRRKKQKYKPEPIVLSLPTPGFFPMRNGVPIRKVEEPMPKGLLDYKNLPLLRQYLTVQGKIRSRKKTRLTSKEQRKVADAIKTARTLAFLPFIRR